MQSRSRMSIIASCTVNPISDGRAHPHRRTTSGGVGLSSTTFQPMSCRLSRGYDKQSGSVQVCSKTRRAESYEAAGRGAALCNNSTVRGEEERVLRVRMRAARMTVVRGLYTATPMRYACGNEYQCRRRADRFTLSALVFPAVWRFVRSGRCDPHSASSRERQRWNRV